MSMIWCVSVGSNRCNVDVFDAVVYQLLAVTARPSLTRWLLLPERTACMSKPRGEMTYFVS